MSPTKLFPWIVLLPFLFRVMQLVAVVLATTMHSSYFPLGVFFFFFIFIFSLSLFPKKRDSKFCDDMG